MAEAKSLRFLPLALSVGLICGTTLLPTQAMAASSHHTAIHTGISQSYRMADQLLQTGRYDQAEAQFTQLLKKNPNNTQARSGLAYSQAELYKLDAAEKNAKLVLSKDPHNAEAHMALGITARNRTASQDMTYRQSRDMYLSQSQRELQAAVSADPNSPEAYNELGTTYRFMGQNRQAAQMFQKALNLDPAYAEALVNEGITQSDMGNNSQAQAMYSKAIKMNSKNYMAHYRLGEAYLKQGDPHSALQSLNTALSLNPDNAAVLTKMAEAYAAQGNQAGAISAYQRAVHSNASFMPAYTGMANLYDQRGDGEAAMLELRSALNVNPNYTPAHDQLGRLALTVDKPDQAIQQYEESLKHNPQDPEALQGLSQALTVVTQKSAESATTMGQDSDLVNAEQALHQAMKYNPNDLRLHLAALRIDQLAGKPQASQQELQRIISSPAHSEPERMIQGEAYLGLGQYTQADGIFQNLISQNSQDPNKLLVIGDTLKSCGDLDGALKAYQAANHADPGNLKAQRGVQRVQAAQTDSEKSLRLANALNNRHQRGSSIDFYEEALSKNPQQPDARLELSKLYEKSHQYDKAATSYQYYLNLVPNLEPKERDKIQKKIVKLQQEAASPNSSSSAPTQSGFMKKISDTLHSF